MSNVPTQTDAFGHFWNGLDSVAPVGSTTASDTIQLIEDQGPSQIPGMSWVINLFEIFDASSGSGVIELDLISEYTGKTRFVAILLGANKYYFMTPVVKGHVYRRSVKLDPVANTIVFLLTDLSTGKSENYVAPIPAGIDPPFISHVFRGIEWHNIQANKIFPVRWVVSISPMVSFSSGPVVSPQPTPTGMTVIPPTGMGTSQDISSSSILLFGGLIALGLILWIVLGGL
jgi:hypothetical protein